LFTIRASRENVVLSIALIGQGAFGQWIVERLDPKPMVAKRGNKLPRVDLVVIALAGIGFDKTEVRIVADHSVTQNVHILEAEGAFGSFAMRIASLEHVAMC
jgi:predicted dinucleotide-utilizing enzyme